MLTLEKIMNKRDMFRARVELMRMLTDLSDDALKYVWRPIAYAWHYTDANDPDVMTDEDLDRMRLIVAVANENQGVIYRTSCMCKAAMNGELKQRRNQRGQAH